MTVLLNLNPAERLKMNAFPNVHDPKTGSMSHGMSLRDYFAAKAMQAILAHPESDATKPSYVFAKAAYQVADAMMKERDL